MLSVTIVSKWLHYFVKKLALVTMKTKVQMKVLFWTVCKLC